MSPYRRVRLEFVAKALEMDLQEAEALLVTCILDGTLVGRIDQAAGILLLNTEDVSVEEAHYKAVDQLTESLEKVLHSVQPVL